MTDTKPGKPASVVLRNPMSQAPSGWGIIDLEGGFSPPACTFPRKAGVCRARYRHLASGRAVLVIGTITVERLYPPTLEAFSLGVRLRSFEPILLPSDFGAMNDDMVRLWNEIQEMLA